MNTDAMLKIEGLTIAYGGLTLLEGLTMSIDRVECVLLAGVNGSGKSSLLRTIAGMQEASCGTVSCEGATVFVPTGIPRVKGFTVRDFLDTSFSSRTRWGVRFNSHAAARSQMALGLVGLAGLADRDTTTLSDGEFQKVCIAAALARMVPADGGEVEGLLLLDEPSSFLDVDARSLLMGTLSRLSHETGLSILFSSHDIHSALPYSDRVLALDGRGKAFLSGKGEDEKMKALSMAFKSLA